MFGGGDVRDFWDRHPDDEALESHVLGQARGAKLARIEEHLLVCAECQERLADLEVFTGAMREAAGQVLTTLGYLHATDEGPVRLRATRTASGQWVARIEGQELETERSFDSLREAYESLQQSFAEMFPEHSCTPLCHYEK
jgi:hypothetical protein